MTELKHAILHSILQKENLCCLCFAAVCSEPIHLDDDAMLDDDPSTVQLAEVLGYTLGDDVVENFAFQTICKDCVTSAIHSYMFIKRCRGNNAVLQQAIENLDSCLESVNETRDSCKSLFLSLDTSLSAQIYYDYKRPVTTISGALARFKYILTDKYNGKYYVHSSNKHRPKTWIAPDIGDDFDDNNDGEFGIPVVKTKKSRGSKKHKQKMEFLSDSEMFHTDSTLKMFICNGCHKTFESEPVLRMHYMRVHAPKKFRCPKCNSKFAASKLLNVHLHTSHTDAVCFECGKTFTNIASLKKHELSHKSTKYICKNCHRVYKTLKTMKDHVSNGVCEQGGRIPRKSTNMGQFVCDICNSHFASKNTVRSHMITKHGYGDDDVVHTCLWCSKRFQAVSSLRGHIVKHTGERKFHCDLCGEKFVTQPALINHTRLHTGEKPYACDYCDESFISASRRIEHLRRKHWEPSLPCRLCPAIFKSGAGKRKHERRHFNPASKLYVPKPERPPGIKEPKELPTKPTRKRRVVDRLIIERVSEEE